MRTNFPDTVSPPQPSSTAIDQLAKLINEHPFPALPLRPLLVEHLLPLLLNPSFSSPSFVSSIFSRLYSAHSLPHKSLELFRFSLLHFPSSLSPCSIPVVINILARSPRRLLFPSSAFLLLDLARRAIPSLLTTAALSALLSPLASRSPSPFDATLSAFNRAERIWAAAGHEPFAANELTALLRAFCACGRLTDARAAFRLLHSRITPDTRSLNTLLLGFGKAGHIAALDLFFHEILVRGFQPDAVSYNIRIHAYCRKNRFFEALQLIVEMERRSIPLTVRTMTTLIHGAGIAGETCRARELFDEMRKRRILPDRGAYNALMGAVVRAGDVQSGIEIFDEMEMKGIEWDDVSFYTILCGFRTLKNFNCFVKVYRRMFEKGFVPRTRTVMLLMKFFCAKGRVDLGLELWEFLLGKGCCPHRHALDALAKELCCQGRVSDAYECFKQIVKRGRLPSERGVQLLEDFLLKADDVEKLKEMRYMICNLKALVPTAS